MVRRLEISAAISMIEKSASFCILMIDVTHDDFIELTSTSRVESSIYGPSLKLREGRIALPFSNFREGVGACPPIFMAGMS